MMMMTSSSNYGKRLHCDEVGDDAVARWMRLAEAAARTVWPRKAGSDSPLKQMMKKSKRSACPSLPSTCPQRRDQERQE